VRKLRSLPGVLSVEREISSIDRNVTCRSYLVVFAAIFYSILVASPIFAADPNLPYGYVYALPVDEHTIRFGPRQVNHGIVIIGSDDLFAVVSLTKI
jgi:hypothetical protein